jgi:preprotein translocase subunit YajC
MIKISKIFVISLILATAILPLAQASQNEIENQLHTISLFISNSGVDATENIQLSLASSEVSTFQFWIQQDATNVELVAVDAGIALTFINKDSSTRECNLSQFNLTINPDQTLNLRLTYTLPSQTREFLKKIFYPTNLLTITYQDNELLRGEYKGQTVDQPSSLRILLHQPTEAPVNIMYIILIFILVVILIASTLLLMRKQRRNVKKSVTESEESLQSKKTLLLSILKDIEKKHRAKEISDSTYTKLKEEYKQQAVDVMKKLENIKK